MFYFTMWKYRRWIFFNWKIFMTQKFSLNCWNFFSSMYCVVCYFTQINFLIQKFRKDAVIYGGDISSSIISINSSKFRTIAMLQNNKTSKLQSLFLYSYLQNVSGIRVLISVSTNCFWCFRRVRFPTRFEALDKHLKKTHYISLYINSVVMVRNKMVAMPSTIFEIRFRKNHHMFFHYFCTKNEKRSYTNFDKKQEHSQALSISW